MNLDSIPEKEIIPTKEEIELKLSQIANEPVFFHRGINDEKGIGIYSVISKKDKDGSYRIYQYARIGFVLPNGEPVTEGGVLVIHYNSDGKNVDHKLIKD